MATTDRDTMKDVDHRPPNDLETDRVWKRGREAADAEDDRE